MASSTRKVRIVCVSDTHNHKPGEGWKLPKGDVLIHAGDLTNQGSAHEIQQALTWIEEADFPVKLVVAGNHDLSLDSDYGLALDSDCWRVEPDDTKACHEIVATASSVTYLQHGSTIVNVPGHDFTIRVFGSPFSPDRGKQNWAFQYDTNRSRTIWDDIPADADVVITHTPPAGYCDTSTHWHEGGCTELLSALWRVKPMLHICGHCHEGRGVRILRWGSKPGSAESVRDWDDSGASNKKQSLLDLTGVRRGPPLDVGNETAVINASIMSSSWGHGGKTFNKPIVIDVELPFRIGERHSAPSSS